jgi:iron complex transport system ATP-binding protein
VVLGANGSGKTCLFGALTGYLTPSSGEITVLGEKYGASDWRELRKRIGFVSSSIRQMIPDHEPAMLTVISGKYAMVDYWGAVRKTDRQDAERILRQVDAGNLATRAWGVLSQGERQRVLIGRALIAKPALLILDEPCAGLDPFAREQFLGFLQQLGLRRSAPALVLVTHHVEEIMPVFTRALLLRNGAVIAAGAKRTVLTSQNLSRAFDANMELTNRAERYALRLRAKTAADRRLRPLRGTVAKRARACFPI